MMARCGCDLEQLAVPWGMAGFFLAIEILTTQQRPKRLTVTKCELIVRVHARERANWFTP